MNLKLNAVVRTVLTAAAALAGGLGLGMAQQASAQPVYTANFDDGTAPGFGNARVRTTPDGTRRFLGDYGNETTTLTLTALTVGQQYEVRCQVYAIASWDGGADRWSVARRGGESFVTSFRSFSGGSQAYPGQYPALSYAGTTGASDYCPCGWSTACNASWPFMYVYPISLSFTAQSAVEFIDFSGLGLESICNESWGIDNIAVSAVLPAPTPTNPIRCVGDSVTFTVSPVSTGQVTGYQWRRNEQPITGATTATLTFSSVAAADAGVYDCVVSTAFGSEVSGGTVLDIGTCGGGTPVSGGPIKVLSINDPATGRGYEAFITGGGITWDAAQAFAVSRGGTLACPSTAAENALLFSLIDRPMFWTGLQGGGRIGPFIGLRQADGGTEPAGGWAWANGETYAATSWAAGQPGNNTAGSNENVAAYLVTTNFGRVPQWHDVLLTTLSGSFLVEYPAPLLTPMSDGCATAVQLPVGTTALAVRSSTVGATADVVPACRGGVAQGPGVWFSFTGTGHPVTLSTCGYFTFDTVLSVFCGSCGSAELLFCAAANDDDCFGGGSRLTLCTEAGRNYYVLVSGYGGATGDFELSIVRATTTCTDAPACGPCPLTIPAGAVAEGEPAAGTDYADNFNAGCDSVPPRFSAIAPGQVIAGRASTFVRGGQDYRDTDQLEFTLAVPAEVLVEGAAVFPLQLGLMDGRAGCRSEETFDFGSSRVGACQTGSIRRVLPAGRFVIFAAPSALSGIPAESPYWLRLTTTPVGGCVVASGCTLATEADCATRGGVYQGNGVVCPDIGYVATVVPEFVFDSLVSTDPLVALSDGDDGGASVAIGFPFVFYDQVYTSVGISSNGYLAFGTEPLNVPTPRAMPDVRAPNAVIAPRWSNLNLRTDTTPPGGGQVRYRYAGAAPTRQLIVQWTDAQQFGFATASTFQVVLSEAEGTIEFRYLSVQDPAFDGQVRAGVENATGTRGTAVASGSVRSNTRVLIRKGNVVAPIARITGITPLGAAAQNVTADSSTSDDPDGVPNQPAIRNVQWDLGADGIGDDAGRTQTQQAFTLAQVLAKGLTLTRTVPLRLTVVDADGIAANAQANLVYANTPPVASAGGPYAAVAPGGTLVLAGAATDADLTFPVGEQLSFEWNTRRYNTVSDFGGAGALGTTLTPSIAFTQLLALANAGSTTLWLNVRDQAGAVASSSVPFSLALPDLRPSQPVGPGSAAFGTTITVTAVISNLGGGGTSGAWSDALWLSPSTLLDANSTRLALQARPADVAAGGSYEQTYSVTLPTRFQSGLFYLIVRSDESGQVAEISETNNTSAVLPVVMSPAAAPDLAVSQVIAPATGTFGSPLAIRWTVTNRGSVASPAGLVDRVYFGASAGLGGAVPLAAEPGTVLQPNASYTRELIITPAINPTASGNFYVTVRADDALSLVEPDEANNVASSPAVAMSPTSSPNLVVSAVATAPTGTSGRPFDVSWTVRNAGTAAATGAWTDRITLRNTTTNAVVTLGEFRHDGPLVPAATYNQLQIVRLPSDIQGPHELCVVTDVLGNVVEPTTGAEADNARCVSPAISINLPLGPDLVVEAITPPATGMVFGTGSTVRFTVRNAGDSPAAGSWNDRVFLSRDAAFSIDDVGMTIVPATEPVESAAQYVREVTVVAPLSATLESGTYYLLVVADASASVQERLENNNVLASAPVTITRPPLPNLTVEGISTPSPAAPGQVVTASYTVRNTGTVPATGRWLERVYASADGVSDGPLVYSNTVDAPLAGGASASRTATFNVPNASLAYSVRVCVDAADQVLESNEGDNCSTGAAATILRPDIAVSSVTAPELAVADAAIQVLYNLQNQGGAPTTAQFLETVTLIRVGTGEEIPLGSFLRIEQLAAGASVPTTRSMPVPTRLDGQFVVRVRADTTDTNFESGPPENNTRAATSITTITQPGRPNLVVTGASATASGLVGTTLAVTYAVANTGQASATAPWTNRISAIKLDAPGINSETILGDVVQSGSLEPDGTAPMLATLTFPSVPGRYRLRITVDRSDAVYEGDAGETDNTFTAAGDFLSETFTVTAAPSVTSAPAGTPVRIMGAARTTSGTALPSIPVTVRIVTQGTARDLSLPPAATGGPNRPIVTDDQGNYVVDFVPLPTEGGRYDIVAGPRNNPGTAPAATFNLYALNAVFGTYNQQLQSGVPFDLGLQVRNPGDVPLTGLTVTISGDQSDLTVTSTVPQGVAANGSATVTLNLLALANAEVRRTLNVQVRSAEGATAQMTVNVLARPLAPTLQATPSTIRASVVRGEQSVVSFELRNIGTVSASDLVVLTPGTIPWISAINPQVLAEPPAGQPAPVLGGGESATVALRLSPGATTPFGVATGSIVVRAGAGGQSSISVPFEFRVVSDQVTDLVVRVEDEATYYDTAGNYIPSGGPIVEGATVQLRDPVSGQMLYQFITSRPGPGQPVPPAVFAGIPERQYLVTVDAANHGNFSQTLVIDSQFATTEPATGRPLLRVFIPYQAVRFNWIVEETTVRDVTIVTLEAVFQTFVPAPVITVSPTIIDLNQYPSGGQIDLTVTNHGLIAVEDVGLGGINSGGLAVTPLTPQLGRLAPGQSRVIPVTITRGESPGSEEPCSATIPLVYSLVCSGRNTYTVPVPLLNTRNDCAGGGLAPPPGSWGGFVSGSSGQSGPGGSFTVPVNSATSRNCSSCDPATSTPVCREAGRTWRLSLGSIADSVVAVLETISPVGLGGDGRLLPDITEVVDERICECCATQGSRSFSRNYTRRFTVDSTVSLDFLSGSVPLGTVANSLLPSSISQTIPYLSRVRLAGHEYDVNWKIEYGVVLIDNIVGLKIEGVQTENRSCDGVLQRCSVQTMEFSFAPTGTAGRLRASSLLSGSGPLNGQTVTAAIFDDALAPLALSLKSYQRICNDSAAEYSLCAKIGLFHVRAQLPQDGYFVTNDSGGVTVYQFDGDPSTQPPVDVRLGAPCFGSTSCCGEALGGGDQIASAVMSRQPGWFSSAPSSVFGVSILREDVAPESAGLCAQVRIQLEQSIAITRTAIRGTLEIDNSFASSPVTGLDVVLAVFDENGTDVTDRFAISTTPTLTNVTAIDGSGTVGPAQRGVASWIILPTRDAAPTNETRYSFGGYVQYVQNNAPRGYVLPPTPLTVRPDPLLDVKYFLQREVMSDDPFTPAVEPAEPFSLGLMMVNRGYGTARNTTVTSSQPRIVENSRNLLIDFQIVGAQVGSQPVEPSLTMRLGDIAPQTTRSGRFLMTTTLLGFFEEFTASFYRRPDYGIDDARVALIDSVTTYDLVRTVRAQKTGSDDQPDFLTDELSGLDDPNENASIPALRHMPDRVHLSDGTVASVASFVSPSVANIPGTSQFRVTVPAPAGFHYTTFADPTGGALRISRVARSDGRILAAQPSIETTSLYNVWQTTRVFRDRQQPLVEPRVHIFDDGGPGEYVLTFETPAAPPSVDGWSLVASHGNAGISVAIPQFAGTELCDPRVGGPQQLVFATTQRLNPANFSSENLSFIGRGVDGTPVDLSGISVSTSLLPGGLGGVVTFNQPLPRKVRYCLNLVGVTDVYGRFVRGQTRVLFNTLPGDVTADRAVTLGDISTVRYRQGEVLTASSSVDVSRCDINRDGVVDEADLAIVTAAAGFDLRFVADPCFGSLVGNGGDPNATQPPPPQVYGELEPNNTPSQATLALGMTYRDTIVGNTQGDAANGPSSADHHRVSSVELPLGIYRHRLQLTTSGTDGFTTALLGRSITPGNPPMIGAIGTAVLQQVVPPISGLHYHQYYDFGRSGAVTLKVSGTLTTTADYSIALKTEPVSPVPLGEYPTGPITVTVRNAGIDSEILLYNSALFPVPGERNDDAVGLPGGRASLSSVLSPGTYFLVISDANTTDDQLNPLTDRTPPRPVTDFADVLVNTSSASGMPLDFSITSAGVTESFGAVKSEPYGIYFAVISVAGCAADVVGNGVPVPDGIVDGNDFIAFINSFAIGDATVDPVADIAGADDDGLAPDGTIDGTDFIAFINAFAVGC